MMGGVVRDILDESQKKKVGEPCQARASILRRLAR